MPRRENAIVLRAPSPFGDGKDIRHDQTRQVEGLLDKQALRGNRQDIGQFNILFTRRTGGDNTLGCTSYSAKINTLSVEAQTHKGGSSHGNKNHWAEGGKKGIDCFVKRLNRKSIKECRWKYARPSKPSQSYI